MAAPGTCAQAPRSCRRKYASLSHPVFFSPKWKPNLKTTSTIDCLAGKFVGDWCLAEHTADI